MPHGYFDNTWAFVRDSGQSRQPCSFRFLGDVTNNILPLFFFFNLYPSPHNRRTGGVHLSGSGNPFRGT